jgi:hypothetical protein
MKGYFMNSSYKLLGIIAIAVIMVFSFTACEGSDSGDKKVVVLTGISALYEQGSKKVFATVTPLGNLKNGLIVMANYDDGSSKPLNADDYYLDGELTIGISVITVLYKEYTDTFNVTVIDPGIVVRNTEDWNAVLAAIQSNGSDQSYAITIDGNIAVPGIADTFTTSFDSNNSNVTVVLRGIGKLYLNTQGSIIRLASGHTLIIDDEDLILEGLRNGQNGSSQDNIYPIIYVEGGTLELIEGTIRGNNILRYGSGVSVYSNGTFTMTGGEISSNTSSNTSGISSINTGGGVYINDSTFTLEGGKISGNNAFYGGGVYFVGSCVFTMTGGEISGNTAWRGGGVYVGSDTTFTMENGKIIDNTLIDNGVAGSGVYVIGGAFTMTGGEISGNTEGGGVDVYDCTFTMTGGKISGNSGSGGVYVSNGTFTMAGGEISGNTSSGSGGGVLVSNSSFIMEGGKISGNTGVEGGGVYFSGSRAYDSSPFTMTGGGISGNTADYSGGGVYVGRGGNLTINGGKISGNISNASSGYGGGGGVFVWDLTFNMTGGEISGNTAGNYGGGVYVNSGTYFSNIDGVITSHTFNSNFKKTGSSIIYGNNGGANSNTASQNGHAVYWSRDGGGSLWRNTTLGAGVDISTDDPGSQLWEQ